MNKSIFKFIPAALAMVALASCNADDRWDTATNYELGKKSMIVDIEDPVMDLNNMRSSMYGSANSRIFNTSDLLRAYDAQLQKYDRYQYTADNNTFSSNDEFVSEPKYMLFPSDMVEYGAWKAETGMFALMKLAVYDGAEGKTDGHLGYAQENRTQNNGAEVIAYTSNLPEFGTINGIEDGTLVEAKSVYLTGFLRIKIENGAQNVKAIRVRSLTEDGQPNKSMPLWGYFDAILDGETTPMSYTTNHSKLAVSTEKLAETYAASHEDRTTLVVDLTGEIKNYTSYVYIPIVPTTAYADAADSEVRYPQLKVEYLEEGEGKTWENDAIEITTFINKEIKSHNGYASKQKAQDSDPSEEMVINGYPLTSSATTLTDVNDFLANLDVDQKELTVDFTAKVASFVITSSNTVLGSYSDNTLTIPESWTGKYKKVTINFSGAGTDDGSTGLITTAQTDNETLTWDVKDKDGVVHSEQQVTPAEMVIKNNSTAEIIVNVSRGSNNTRYVKVNVAKNEGTVTLGKNVYTISGNAGEIVVDATNSTATNVTVTATDGDANIQVVGGTVATLTNNGSGTVTINGAKVTTLTNAGGDVTVENNAEVEKIDNNGEGNIKVAGAKVINLSNGVNGGDITYTDITGRTNNISSQAKGKSFIFKNEKKVVNTNLIHTIAVQAATVEIANVDIDTYLRFSAPLTSVSLENCEVKLLTHNGGKTVTLKSYGNTFIEKVQEGTTDYGQLEEPYMTFKSEWNGGTTAPAVITKAVGTTYDVYTASELAQLLPQLNLNTLTVNLYADIDLKDIAWAGIKAFYPNSGTLNGNNHTIENIAIDTKGRTAITDGTGFINNTGNKNKFTAKDLTLLYVKNYADNNENGRMRGIGGFVGAQWNAGEYTNIKVVASNLGVEARDVYKDGTKGCLQVGGLIGAINDQTGSEIASETTIEKCDVYASNIVGQWSLGGLVGDARGTGTNKAIKLTMTGNTVEVKKYTVTLTLPTGTNSDDHYGRVGELLGTASEGAVGTTLVFGTDEEANTVVDKGYVAKNTDTLYFSKCARILGNNAQKFIGKPVGDVIYVGYCPDFEGKTNTVTGLEGVGTIDDFNAFTNLELARKR